MTWSLKNIKFLCPENCFGCFSSMLWVTCTVKPINLFLFTSFRRYINHTHQCDLVPLAAFTVTLYLRSWVGFVYFVWFFLLVCILVGCLKSTSNTIKPQSRQVPSASCWGSLRDALVTGSTGLFQPCLWQTLLSEVLLNRKPQQRNQNSIVCLQNLPCVPNQKKTGDKDRYSKQDNCHKHPLAPCWVRKL